MIEAEEDRFDRLLKLAPCRFHISDDPRLGVGLVMRCQVNNDNEDGPKFFTQRDGIRNCKPGIWTSLRRHVANDDPDNEYEVEYILRWVASGTIDISQPLKEWEEYEKSTREADAQVKLSQIVPRGVKWRRNGTYFSDDGICAVISSEYLTSEAAANIQFGRAEEIDEYNYGGYLEFLSPPGFGPGQGDSGGFTIGGVKFWQDEVGGPPWVALAKEDGQVITVRIHRGHDEDENRSEGTEKGFSSNDDLEECAELIAIQSAG